MVPGDNLMKIHKKTPRNLTTALVTTHHMQAFHVYLTVAFLRLNCVKNLKSPSREIRQYYCKFKKAKLKHKLTHALGISPTLAPSKHDRRAAAACVSQPELPPTSQAQRGTINIRSHHLQHDELGEYLRTRSLDFSHEVQRGHSLD